MGRRGSGSRLPVAVRLAPEAPTEIQRLSSWAVVGLLDVATALRPCTLDDVPAVLALLGADEERVTGRPTRLGESDVRTWWGRVHLETESLLLTDGGALVGVTWLRRDGDDLAFAVPVAAREQDLPELLDLVERRAGELGLARLHMMSLVSDPPVEQLLAGRGYRDVRHFFDMAIELDAAAPIVLPPGFTVHVTTPDDARVFHATTEEAFQDHWEHHDRPFEEWWQRLTKDPQFDISWLVTARQGDQTVAAVHAVPGRNGGVYVSSLGVRRPWRGQGVAKAMLMHTFARAFEAGTTRVTLGVDAANPTGATALYRSVGVTEELESAAWEKHVSPDPS